MARSPSYPGIDLQTALARARAFYDHEKRNAAPASTIIGHWGYKTPSGPARSTLAALKKFGLTTEHGQGPGRQVRLSDLALRILLDEREDSSERQNAIREATLTPGIHAELWSKYGTDMPSDATIAYYLTFERKFTDSGAAELVQEYRATLAFAGLDQPGTVQGHSGGAGTGEQPVSSVDKLLGRQGVPPMPATVQVGRSLQIPLPGGGAATLATSRPLTDSEWSTLTTVVNAMKPSFVEETVTHISDGAHSTGGDDAED